MKIKRLNVAFIVLVMAIAGIAWTAGETIASATVVIQVADGPGEGFNDNTPWTPTGGNPATTLGQARLNAFQYAADIWAGCLTSSEVIYVSAKMDPLTCTPTSAVLGGAGTTSIHFFSPQDNAPLSMTWYPQALANAIAGSDQSPLWDINATFNSNLDGGGCLGGARWYYGYD
ncbi:MAG: peptidase, partial [Candidatus Krumholzibacteria bacterium]|nr:peptidase [Candidatus Krumholzibacteria bacterium]